MKREDLLFLTNLQENKDVWQKITKTYELHTKVSAQIALDVYDGVAMQVDKRVSKFMESVESLANMPMNTGRVVLEEDM